MHNFIVEDIVIYLKEKESRLYTIKKIYNDRCVICGLTHRIIRDVNINEINKASKELIKNADEGFKKYRNKLINTLERSKNNFILGKILHIDGDEKYLNKCLELYNQLGVYAYGVQIDEVDIYKKIEHFLFEVNPDIVVITGHDFFDGEDVKDLSNYKNTNNFIKAIKCIRKTNQRCCIVAGACQSNFEALIANGADFASSPGRINIHVYDPAVIAIKVATTSFRQIVSVDNIYKYIENGSKAFGGVQTTGKMKMLL